MHIYFYLKEKSWKPVEIGKNVKDYSAPLSSHSRSYLAKQLPAST